MGREILYCWKCATRLSGDDFGRGKAYRYGDKAACSECVFDLVADLPAEEQEAILQPPAHKPSSAKVKAVPESGPQTGLRRTGSTPRQRTGMTGKIPVTPDRGTRTIPKRSTGPVPKAQAPPEVEEGEEEAQGEEDPAKKKRKILLLAGGGGGLLVVLGIVLVLVLGGGKKPEPAPEALDSGIVKSKGSTKKVEPKESPADLKAKPYFKAAEKIKADHPNDLVLQWNSWSEAAEKCKGSSFEGKPEAELDLLKEKLDKEIAEVQKQCEKLMENEEFKKILDLWEAEKARYDLEILAKAVDTKIKQYKDIRDDRFRNAKKEVLAALADDNIQRKLDVIKRISTWGYPDLVAELDNVKPESEPAANPANPDAKIPPAAAMSPEMKAFMPVWQNAVLPAYGRDFIAASDALTKAAKDTDVAEAKKASTGDAADLLKFPPILEEGKKAAAAWKKLDSVTVEYQAAPSDWKKVAGKVVKVDPLRVELATDLKDKPRMFIDFADFSAATLAELWLTQPQKTTPENQRLAAILCLLEGNVEAAKRLAGPYAGRVADRYWKFAPEIRDRAPKPSSREFEARDLFLRAEVEWPELKTRAAAFEKYKLLLGDYASTEYVRRSQAIMTSRMETAKEYVFTPLTLNTPGAMNTFKPSRSYKPKVELALVTSKELEFNACQENYLKIEFYALPNVNYRCWLLVGGCCAETMTFYYQTTEGKAKKDGKDVSIEPGGRSIETYIPQLPSLPKDHAKHKPKDPKASHPKDPTRWDWIEIKLPRPYAAPGAKELRIFTEQPGFGIAYALISSTRTGMPDAKVKAELDRDLGGGEGGLKGTSEPKDWLLIGPFPEPLTAAQGPESEIDLLKEYPGKKDKVRWKPGSPTLNGTTALFEWDKNGMFTPKDGVSVYALIHVKAPSSMAAQLWLGHDDACRVWMNGNLIHSLEKLSTLKGDEHKVKIQFDEGVWNRFLFKVTNKTATFGLAVRWVDSSGKPIEGLEFSAYGDKLGNK